MSSSAVVALLGAVVLLEAGGLVLQQRRCECAALGAAHGFEHSYVLGKGCLLATADGWIPASSFDWRLPPPTPD